MPPGSAAPTGDGFGDRDLYKFITQPAEGQPSAATSTSGARRPRGSDRELELLELPLLVTLELLCLVD